MKLELDRYQGRKYLCDKVAAKEFGVQKSLLTHAHFIAAIADADLRSHHHRSDVRIARQHNLPAPTIKVERRHDEPYGSVDYFVVLEAVAGDPKTAMMRAVGIEYGHHRESREQNPSGPWNESPGIHVLAGAAGIAEAFGQLG